MSSDDYEDYCEVWPENPDPKIPEDESRTCAMFSLVLHLSFIYLPHDLMEEQDEVLEINNLMETVMDDQTFQVERDRLIDNNTSQQIIEGILSSMEVPSRPFMVEKILSCARHMANDKLYESHKVLRMHVRMSVVVDEKVLQDSEDDEEEEESAMVGASRETVEKLERVKIEELSRPRACAICLEEFPLCLQVTRLPCSHIYHGNCIFNWLNKSKFCPLCRFEIK